MAAPEGHAEHLTPCVDGDRPRVPDREDRLRTLSQGKTCLPLAGTSRARPSRLSRLRLVDRDRLGQLLAAVGNHEGKALTFLAMEDVVTYGVSSLHRRFLEIQGPHPIFVGTVNLQQKYVLYTFEPVGLVARTLAGGQYLRHLKTDVDETATALAANLLVATEGLDTSLMQLFGKTAAKEGHDRSPIRRLDALRVIHDSPEPISQADLLRTVDLGIGVGAMLTALHSAGWIQYETSMTAEMKSSYRVLRPLEPEVRERAFTREIRELLNARLLTQPAGFVISRDQIEDALMSSRPGRYIRDQLQGVMSRLADRGAVELEDSFRGQRTHSSISLTALQRERVGRVLQVVDAIQAEDRDAIRQGVEAGRHLLTEPHRVCALMQRCFETNKAVVNPLTAAQKERRVLQALESGPATSAELLERLRPALNKQLIGITLRDLALKGQIAATKLDRTPAKVYALTEGVHNG